MASDVRLRAAAQLLRASTDAFVSFLSGLPDTDAEAPLPGRWSPAGHGYHVALTNGVFAAVIAGTAPLKMFEGTPDFSDEAWNFDAPLRVAAPAIIVPPADVTKAAAIAKLEAEAAALTRAMSTLDQARTALCVQLPWAAVSILQMCEWSAGHTLRHLSQVGREMQQAAAGTAAR